MSCTCVVDELFQKLFFLGSVAAMMGTAHMSYHGLRFFCHSYQDILYMIYIDLLRFETFLQGLVSDTICKVSWVGGCVG